MSFFTTEEISPRRRKTPEGYLVCTDVVISRVGTFDKSPEEAGVDPAQDGVVHTIRSEEQLFDDATIASFEGKPLVVGHDDFVSPDNWSDITKGVVQNVRQGEDGDKDLLLADLLVTDQETIEKIESGEFKFLSAGYNCDVVPTEKEGYVKLENIIGNHVAIVDAPNCGRVCSIGDSKLKSKMTLKDRLVRLIKDSNEEDIKTLADEDPKSDEKPVCDEDQGPNMADEDVPSLEERIQKIEDSLNMLIQKLDEKNQEVADEQDEPSDEQEQFADEEEVNDVVDDAQEIDPAAERPMGDSKGRIKKKQLTKLMSDSLKSYGVKTKGMTPGEINACFKGTVSVVRKGNNPMARIFTDGKNANSINQVFKNFWSSKSSI